MKNNILLIGSGGREHALAWKLHQSPLVGTIYIAPGNGGTQMVGKNVDIAVDDIDGLLSFAQTHHIDLTVVGPEISLEKGIVDRFRAEKLRIFGPTQKAAKLETSKAWSAKFMQTYNIPRPKSTTLTHYDQAIIYLNQYKEHIESIVIKVDGLAAGKGVFLPSTYEEAVETLKHIMVEHAYGNAGASVIVQERLIGEEVSFMVFCDGVHAVPMVPAQDYKRAHDNDQGLNTGGMGAQAPSPEKALNLIPEIMNTIIMPTVEGMQKERMPFTGVLYAGLMLTEKGPKVLEYNARFGDPETQCLMRLLDSDLYTILSHCTTGELVEEDVKFTQQSAITVVLAAEGYPGVHKKNQLIHGLDINTDQVISFHAGTRENKEHIVTNGGRVLNITAVGATKKEAREKIYNAIGKNGIWFEGMYYRQDIGKEKTLSSSLLQGRLEVFSTVSDMRSRVRLEKLHVSFPTVTDVFIEDVYTFSTSLPIDQLEKSFQLLVNPITQASRISSENNKQFLKKPFSWVIEIGFLPGVTDNVATTVHEMISEFTQKNDVGEFYTSQLTYITGHLSKEEVDTIAQSLYNPLIQRVHIKSYESYTKELGMDIIIPKVTITQQPSVSFIDLHGNDAELLDMSKKGIKNTDGTHRGPLALDLPYIYAIRDYFDGLKRKPTDVEIESIAQTWSEHCKHTIFRDPLDELSDGLYKTYIQRATEYIRKKRQDKDICVSVFADNSGAIVFDDEYLITDKVETHNSPSALDPFGGAITGIVGVNRDALGFGLGAKPILNRYGFCLADPSSSVTLYRDREKTQPLLPAKRIFDGVVSGVNSGGNCSGIPTPLGFLYFDKRFRGKPLVFAGTVGLIPRERNTVSLWQKGARPNDYIVMVGGRVGIDGIHGATFSSEALSLGSPATAVQIGDPITQKKLSDALVKEARDAGLYTSITDNGAGGLSCSVAEMAKESGGCRVYLEHVPLKYPGLEPWQIWISESQERMTLSVPPDKWQEFSDLMTNRGVEATIIGQFTDSGQCIVSYNGMTVMDVSMQFLHDGLPARPMKSEWVAPQFSQSSVPSLSDLNQVLLGLMHQLNIGSIESISTQYDHEVQASSVVKPLQGKGRVNGEASIIRPLLDSNKGVIVSYGLYPAYSDINPYNMAASSIDTAIRNVIVAGGTLDHLALLDNFCWCSPTDPKRLGQLKLAAQALYDYSVSYETPIISGKDSMYNDFKGFDSEGKQIVVSIPPTLLISSIGVMNDIRQAVTIDIKTPGDLIYVLGETFDELGGSEYYAWVSESVGEEVQSTSVPSVNATQNATLYRLYEQCIKKEIISSGISVGKGGILIALAKQAIAGKLGQHLSLPNNVSLSSEQFLFSESQGRIVVSIDPANRDTFEEIMKDVSCTFLGTVTKEPVFKVQDMKDKTIISLSLKDIDTSYKSHFGIVYAHKPTAAIIAGYGINCEEETAMAFEKANGTSQIVHVNDIINGSVSLSRFEILAFPGGFAFGDDTGSGNAFAQKVKNTLWEELMRFVMDDHLVIGICNGFQVLVNLGLLPAIQGNYGKREVALIHNDNATYTDRWVDLHFGSSSPWCKDMTDVSFPIAHGEGKFYAKPEILRQLNQKKLIAARYIKGEICHYQSMSPNPNGSLEDIAAITDESGRIFGIMPHPERAMLFTHLPYWPLLKERYKRSGKLLPEDGPGLKLFQNAVEYFS